MTDAAIDIAHSTETVEIRVRGTVQGVGFRPTVWRFARDSGLAGEVRNDAAGVLIKVSGSSCAIANFLERLRNEAPPLSHIEAIETRHLAEILDFQDFHIAESIEGENRTRVTPDAATCSACREEVLSSFERRYLYPFTNCTHCGPRFSIVKAIPYDRANTTMAVFPMCQQCACEYRAPADRRFHAQPIACHVCGPKVWLERLDEQSVASTQHSKFDDVDAAAMLIQQGEIVAIRGIGGFHLACDATNDDTVKRLRACKRRFGKPFALMARDLEIISRYCSITDIEQSLLESPEAPIVLLKADGIEQLPESVAPGFNSLGFMLPYTPLHLLLVKQLDRPVVMTSGNLSDEPQILSNEEARLKLKGIADAVLFHNRDIANRIDDSVVRVMGGKPRLLRRARGYAPSALPLPAGFEKATDLLAYGGELKATFCLVKDGAAILSQHQGDLEDLATFEDYQKNLRLYATLYDHQPRLLAADLHPEYLSTKLAKENAEAEGLPLLKIQHHHAHIASCLAENGIPLATQPVLGIAIDGLGFGDDGTIWGGEFMLADYRSYKRIGTFKPVAMIGGAQAIREPWRNTYAHLIAAFGWAQFAERFSDLELYDYLNKKPRQTIESMLKKGLNVPLASSCGRLFDAVSAAIGLCRDRALFEGQGAIELEMVVDEKVLREEDEALAYPFTIANLPGTELTYLEPAAMWDALLGDLLVETPAPVMAARFHKGLAKVISALVQRLGHKCEQESSSFSTVALSGGCFQNKILLEEVTRRIEANGLKCLSQSKVPANDGGLALGQAAIAASRQLPIN
jgi:hydrogenase maturation protein HypF